MWRSQTINAALIAALLPLQRVAATTAANATTAAISGFPPVRFADLNAQMCRRMHLFGRLTDCPQCDALVQAGFSDRLLLPTYPEYKSRIESYWALNSQLHPWCIVQPQNETEVAKVMTTLFAAGHGAGDWHIAVRAGGHNLAHTNNIDTGVTIDLVNLNETTYDNETNLASIGPGAKWLDVYTKLHDHGVVVTGGRDGTVGVGGFLLGGGMTYFMGRNAFACDTIKNFEVVLTNGTIVNANVDQNSDLWKALKGGGSNFGIVTRFYMEALPDKDIAFGLRLMSTNYTSQFLNTVVHFTDHYHEFDSDALVPFLMHMPDIPEDFVLAALHVNVDGNKNSTGLSQLEQIPPMEEDETQLVPLVEAANSSTVIPPQW